MNATAFATLIIFGLTIGIGSSAPSHAQDLCPQTDRALEEAQKILDTFDTSDRQQVGIALACLAQALEQTRAELDGLREGSIAFSGQINAPKGFIMSKPSVQEDR